VENRPVPFAQGARQVGGQEEPGLPPGGPARRDAGHGRARRAHQCRGRSQSRDLLQEFGAPGTGCGSPAIGPAVPVHPRQDGRGGTRLLGPDSHPLCHRQPHGTAMPVDLATVVPGRGHNPPPIALSSPAESVRHAGAGSVNYVADYVMDQLDETIGAIDNDVVVRTTVIPSLQGAAEKALSEELDRSGVRMGVSQGALIALSPSGEIRALVGGRNYAESQFNRAVSARRQPGSAFKPFVMKVLEPFRTQPSDVRVAEVRMAARSEPAVGSVIAIAVISSPEQNEGSHRSLCSAVASSTR